MQIQQMYTNSRTDLDRSKVFSLKRVIRGYLFSISYHTQTVYSLLYTLLLLLLLLRIGRARFDGHTSPGGWTRMMVIIMSIIFENEMRRTRGNDPNKCKRSVVFVSFASCSNIESCWNERIRNYLAK